MTYSILKLIHIISATIMFGTGLGSAFYLFYSWKYLKLSTVKDVLNIVIFADYIFTTLSVILQLVTGIWLSSLMGLLTSGWFLIVIIFSVLVFALWIRAVFLQLQMRKALRDADTFTDKFQRQMKEWIFLGVPAFIGTLIIFYLMVFRPLF